MVSIKKHSGKTIVCEPLLFAMHLSYNHIFSFKQSLHYYPNFKDFNK
jgi:hypothetical protein